MSLLDNPLVSHVTINVALVLLLLEQSFMYSTESNQIIVNAHYWTLNASSTLSTSHSYPLKPKPTNKPIPTPSGKYTKYEHDILTGAAIPMKYNDTMKAARTYSTATTDTIKSAIAATDTRISYLVFHGLDVVSDVYNSTSINILVNNMSNDMNGILNDINGYFISCATPTTTTRPSYTPDAFIYYASPTASDAISYGHPTVVAGGGTGSGSFFSLEGKGVAGGGTAFEYSYKIDATIPNDRENNKIFNGYVFNGQVNENNNINNKSIATLSGTDGIGIGGGVGVAATDAALSSATPTHTSPFWQQHYHLLN